MGEQILPQIFGVKIQNKMFETTPSTTLRCVFEDANFGWMQLQP